jgi:hypothetical protein
MIVIEVENVIPDDHQDHRKNMGPGKPVHLRGGGSKYNNRDGGNYVAVIGTDDFEKQEKGERNEESKEDYQTGHAKTSVDNGHDDFGKPFMGGPGEGRGKVGEHVVAREGEGFENVFARSNMVAGISIIEEVFSHR